MSLRPAAYSAVLRNTVLLCAAIVFFVFSHPNVFIQDGVFFLGFVFLVPVFLLISHARMRSVWLYGFVYGALGYTLYCYWLASFHPATIFIVFACYGCILAFVFCVLRLAYVLGGRYGFFFMALVWCAYEYIKTLGFVGFGYGVCAYTQWRFLPLANTASLWGIWGISFLLAECAAVACTALVRRLPAGHCAIAVAAWIAVFAAALGYGAAQSQAQYDTLPQVRVAAVQQNSAPWSGGIDSYEADFESLCRLSRAAMAEQAGTQLVVWPETSFVPPVLHYYDSAEDYRRSRLVRRLLDFVDSGDAILVTGNDHAEFTQAERRDYNAALVFVPHVSTNPPRPGIYLKQHLVPFTEYFPFQEQFPRLNEILLNGDTHYWSCGRDATVFFTEAADFSVPICFEDTFGPLCAQMVRKGARLLLNLTNDSWSQSVACQKQHLAMGVFRAVENRVPLVIAAVSGQTAAVLPNGRVVAEAEPFVRTYITAEVPDMRAAYKETAYTRGGDCMGFAFVVLAAAFFVAGALRFILFKFRQ